MKDSAVKSTFRPLIWRAYVQMGSLRRRRESGEGHDCRQTTSRGQSPTIAASFSTVFQLRAVPSGARLVFFQSRSSIEWPTSTG
jgi:hypothetical protein